VARIGIVGGIGPESTIAYYRLLIAEGHTDVVISSVDVNRLLGMMGVNDLAAVTAYLSAAVATLGGAGAEMAIIAANTPHVVFDEIRGRAEIPMVSIVEATAAHVAAMGLKRVGLLGTRYTMEGTFYPDVLERHGISVVTPLAEERAVVHDRYVNELLRNVFLPETRARLLDVVDAMVQRDSIEGVILGGTELPLLLKDAAHAGIPLLDTTVIHVRAALRFRPDGGSAAAVS
jgi:aspartate racemase